MRHPQQTLPVQHVRATRHAPAIAHPLTPSQAWLLCPAPTLRLRIKAVVTKLSAMLYSSDFTHLQARYHGDCLFAAQPHARYLFDSRPFFLLHTVFYSFELAQGLFPHRVPFNACLLPRNQSRAVLQNLGESTSLMTSFSSASCLMVQWLQSAQQKGEAA